MKNFSEAPVVVIWETTRACALRCVHCRADAIPHRDPDELSTEEGRRLIEQVRAFSSPPPMLVLTGGDPLRRPDIVELVAHGTELGLSVSLTPSGTAAVTREKLQALQQAGLARLAVSLDGATAETHDAFRRVRGSHAYTLRIIEHARSLGLPLQINTTVCRQTLDELAPLARQMEDLNVVLWALFFLIPVGRAQAHHALSAPQIEDVLEWAARVGTRVPFRIKTTEAPHYLRVAMPRAPTARAVTDGNGFVFVDHTGIICPSGFLPLPAGNVRRDDLVTVYRTGPLFRALRDPSRLGGRCGRCEYRERCGGSRARAFASSGDALGEDPGCVYQPEGATVSLHVISGGSDTPLDGAPTNVPRDAVERALQNVLDPELGLSVMDLGLVYDIAIDRGRVAITMTLTVPGCPIHDAMTDWVREAVSKVPAVTGVDVTVTFDPPWTPDRITRRPAAGGSHAPEGLLRARASAHPEASGHTS